MVTGFKKNKQKIWTESRIGAKSGPGNNNMAFILLTPPSFEDAKSINKYDRVVLVGGENIA